MFWLRSKKNLFQLRIFIWKPESTGLSVQRVDMMHLKRETFILLLQVLLRRIIRRAFYYQVSINSSLDALTLCIQV